MSVIGNQGRFIPQSIGTQCFRLTSLTTFLCSHRSASVRSTNAHVSRVIRPDQSNAGYRVAFDVAVIVGFKRDQPRRRTVDFRLLRHLSPIR